MYQVLCDGSSLYDPHVEDLNLTEARVSLEVNRAGSFTFRIYPDNPMYGQIRKLKSSIEVFQDNVSIFRGRVLTDTRLFDLGRDIYCEGDLALLNDSVMRPYEYTGSVSGYLDLLINSHNVQVDSDKQFKIGSVTVTDPNDYITRSNINHAQTWQEVNDKLIGSSLGGYLVIRREDGVNYLDYLTDSPYMSTQTIEIGQNLLDVIQEARADEIITALIPLGTKLKDAEGNDTDARLTIEQVNDGVDYVYDEDAVAEYGWIFGTQVWDDVAVPQNLLARANAALAVRVNLGLSVTLRAVDLSLTGADIDEIRLFDYVRVLSPPHDIDTMALITKLDLDLLNPSNNGLAFGFDFQSLTDKQYHSDKAIREITSDYVTNAALSGVRDTVTQLSSVIAQTAETIRTEVSETYISSGYFDEYKDTVSTEFAQTATDYTYLFSQLETYVQTLDGDTRAQFNEIVKYIRFVDGKIVLGEVNNPLTLEIANDRISFLQSGAEVAYITNNVLFITDGQFLTSLRIGNFAFMPRTNGNLSFNKVV